MQVKLDVKLHIVLTISVHLRIATVKARQKSVKYLCALMLQSLKLSCEFLVGLSESIEQCKSHRYVEGCHFKDGFRANCVGQRGQEFEDLLTRARDWSLERTCESKDMGVDRQRILFCHIQIMNSNSTLGRDLSLKY